MRGSNEGWVGGGGTRDYEEGDMGLQRKKGKWKNGGVVWGCEEGRGGGHNQGGWMGEVNRSVHLKLVGSSGFTSLITDFGSSTPVKRLPNSNR